MQRSALSIRRCPVAHVMLGLALVLCASARRIAAQSVPAHAPDSISSVLWDSLTAPANIMTDPPGLRGRWARNVMMISFQPSATQADRRAVIDLIHGEVLGGNTWPMGEGEYIVRIPYATAPGDSISGPVLRAFLALHGHPSILTAYPLSMDNFSRIYDTRAKAQAGAPRAPALTPVLPPRLRAARGSRRRHEIIGAVVGAAAGLVVYAVDQHGCRSQNGIPCGLGAGNELMILMGGGALGGALVGAALPHGP